MKLLRVRVRPRLSSFHGVSQAIFSDKAVEMKWTELSKVFTIAPIYKYIPLFVYQDQTVILPVMVPNSLERISLY